MPHHTFSPPLTPIRVALLEGHQLVAEAFEALFSQIPTITFVRWFTDGSLLLHSLEKGPFPAYDLLICDLWLGQGQSCIPVLNAIRALPTHLPVLVLTADESAESIRLGFQAGAYGYLSKASSLTEIQQAIEQIIYKQERYLSPRLLDAVLFSPTDKLTDFLRHSPLLTPREIEVWQLVARAYENQQVADQLSISVKTVESHRKKLMQKLEVKNAIALANLAFRYGLDQYVHNELTS